jgi:WD40 repeat protein
LAWADNASLKIWDTQENRLLHNISIGDVHVDRLSWSPDGFILATIGGRRIEGRSNGVLTEYYVDWDSKIHLWDPVTGEDIRVATGHNGGISQLEWSPNGNHLATTGPDGTIIIWGVSE